MLPRELKADQFSSYPSEAKALAVENLAVLRELPLSLPPVRGIIVAQPSTPLSHINILAHGWNIPNVYIKDADKRGDQPIPSPLAILESLAWPVSILALLGLVLCWLGLGLP